MESTPPLIPAAEAFRHVQRGASVIDVRSPGEHAKGAFPTAVNIPILNDEHRHQVGCTYKTDGKEAAIALGHSLVRDLRETLLERWVATANASRTLLYCWRGGLRSEIAAQWIADAGAHVDRVQNGFRGLRRVALRALETPPPLLVISGMTGSGKTDAFRDHPDFLDLERAAEHRGSAFGAFIGAHQAVQIDFEHRVALAIFERKSRLLVEDESRMVGERHIPEPLYQAMGRAPSIFLESPLEERARRICAGYVVGPLREGIDKRAVEDHLLNGVQRIAKRLGPELAAVVQLGLKDAFQHGPTDEDRHMAWVSAILEGYYDKTYRHALQKKDRQILFRGDATACQQWLEQAPDLTAATPAA